MGVLCLHVFKGLQKIVTVGVIAQDQNTRIRFYLQTTITSFLRNLFKILLAGIYGYVSHFAAHCQVKLCPHAFILYYADTVIHYFLSLL